jgi:Prophage CP4-57 regulatory protein (AlpA)
MSDKLFTADELFSSRKKPGRVPFTRQHGARLEERGKFPQRIQLGAGRVAWSEREIEEWIKNLPRGPLQFRGRRALSAAATREDPLRPTTRRTPP